MRSIMILIPLVFFGLNSFSVPSARAEGESELLETQQDGSSPEGWGDERVEALLDALMLASDEEAEPSQNFKPGSRALPPRKDELYPPYRPSVAAPPRPTPRRTPPISPRTARAPMKSSATPSRNSSPTLTTPSATTLLASLTPQALRSWVDSISRRLPDSGALYGCFMAWKSRLEWIIAADLRGEKIRIMDLFQIFYDYRTSSDFQGCRNLGLSRLLDFEMPKQLKQILSGEMEYYKLLLLEYLESKLSPQAETRPNPRGPGSR